MKVCSYCKVEKSSSNFSLDRSRPDGLQRCCKDCSRLIHKAHYQKNKEKYAASSQRHKESVRKLRDELKSKPCSDYGIQFPPWIMQFDHVKGNKSFCISDTAYITKKTLIEEASKCEVVCANCHAHRTFLSNTKHKDLK